MLQWSIDFSHHESIMMNLQAHGCIDGILTPGVNDWHYTMNLCYSMHDKQPTIAIKCMLILPQVSCSYNIIDFLAKY
jgi:hypothetical protein